MFVVLGIALLKVGGRMVYSTCSLNPVENEAVVGEVSVARLLSLIFTMNLSYLFGKAVYLIYLNS
jgi:hypothetical protein